MTAYEAIVKIRIEAPDHQVEERLDEALFEMFGEDFTLVDINLAPDVSAAERSPSTSMNARAE